MLVQEKDLADSVYRISGSDPKKCMKCGKCSATCPSFEEMDVRPHRFVKMIEEGRIEQLMKSQSLWRCLSCFACVERCPRGVEPAKLVEAVRLVAVRRQGYNYKTPDDIPGLVELDGLVPQQLITGALRKFNK